LRKVVFPVAGLGTRFLPATKVVAKEMLPVLDRPLIQYAVDEAVDAGAETLVFVTNRYKHSIADYFDSAYELEETLERAGKHELLAMVQGLLPPHVRCVYVTQEQALGLGHAVLCAKAVVGDEPFGVILPDDLIVNDGPGALRQMAERIVDGGGVLAVEEVPQADTGKYGIVAVDAGGERIRHMVEKPRPEEAPSNLAVVGRYVLPARIFELLEQTTPGAGGEIQLTDAMLALLKRQPFSAVKYEGRTFDCGSKVGFLTANVAYALARPDIAEAFKAEIKKLL
jgi:UTP--glucose-1-phosphate uridylyltransferase